MNRLRRSIVLALATAPFASTPRATPYVPGSKRRLGVIYMPPREIVESMPYDAAPLAAHGWVEGRTLETVKRYADRNASRFDALARELVEERVDVLLAAGIPCSRAMQRATKTIPICAIVDDPVGNGFAKTMSRPGGNITGLCEGLAEMAEKAIQLLQTAMPRLAHLVVVSTTYDAAHLRRTSDWLTKAAAKAGLSMDAHFVDSRARIEALVRSLPAGKSVIYLRWTTDEAVELISRVAAERRIAVTAQEESFVDHGALMTFRPEIAENHQLAAMLDRLLRGGNPAEIPFEQPTKYVFAVNRNAATAIGLTLPAELVLRADKVV